MDFRELQYVVTVADCRNITQAAKQLYISQPSLSYALARIEKEIGVKLFDRSQQPLALTDAGIIYVKTARDILQERIEMKNRLADLKDGQGARISLGIPAERAGYMLPPIINTFRQRFPDSEFFIQEAGTDELIELLKNNKVTFLVCPRDQEYLPVPMVTELIYREKVQLIAAEDAFTDDMFMDKASRLVDLKKLEHMPFIGIKKRHSIHAQVERIFRQYDISPKELMEVESSMTAVQLAACGLGFTIVPGRAKKILGPDYARYCYDYSPHPFQWNINAIYKKNSYLNKAERYFIDLLKREFGSREV